MQTFMPYSDFKLVAKCLDNKRLGKQRVECLQIYKALTEENYGWKNHPIVKMWKGHELALLDYSIIICKEWISRGFKDTMLERFRELWSKEIRGVIAYEQPQWIFDEELQLSHQSNLVRKDEKHYRKFFDVPNNIEYKWVR